MSAAATANSPSATAENTAREGVLAMLRAGGHIGERPHQNAYSFCQCCGAMILGEDGLVFNSSNSQRTPPGKDGLAEWLKKQYGPDAEKRFGASGWKATLHNYSRADKPGVWFSFMKDTDAAVKLVYPTKSKDAKFYSIDDPEHGRLDILWLDNDESP